MTLIKLVARPIELGGEADQGRRLVIAVGNIREARKAYDGRFTEKAGRFKNLTDPFLPLFYLFLSFLISATSTTHAPIVNKLIPVLTATSPHLPHCTAGLDGRIAEIRSDDPNRQVPKNSNELFLISTPIL